MKGEFKALLISATALVALAAIVLVGSAITTQYGYFLRLDTTVNASTTNLVTLSNTTYKRVGTTGTYPFLQDLDDCVNASGGNAIASGNYTILEGDVNGGYVKLTGDDNWNNTGINCSTLEYKAATTGSTTAGTFDTALTLFATFAGILVLSIIGVAIVNLYKQGKGGYA